MMTTRCHDLRTVSRSPIRVVLADDHPVVRRGLAALLDSVEGIEVVGQAATGREAVREAQLLAPDVVLMDVQMPDLDGVEASRRIATASPGVAVLVLTMHDDDETVVAALRAGARGFLLKGADQEDPPRGRRGRRRRDDRGAVGRGRTSSRGWPWSRPRRAPFPDLTPRERAVLAPMAGGRRNGVIAAELGLAAKTVANHVSAILLKLGVETRGEAVLRARDAGLGGIRGDGTRPAPVAPPSRSSVELAGVLVVGAATALSRGGARLSRCPGSRGRSAPSSWARPSASPRPWSGDGGGEAAGSGAGWIAAVGVALLGHRRAGGGRGPRPGAGHARVRGLGVVFGPRAARSRAGLPDRTSRARRRALRPRWWSRSAGSRWSSRPVAWAVTITGGVSLLVTAVSAVVWSRSERSRDVDRERILWLLLGAGGGHGGGRRTPPLRGRAAARRRSPRSSC